MLLEILLRDDTYDFDLEPRCANKRLIGVRFLATPPVELALGTPCNQAVWAFKRAGKTELWGAVLSRRAAESLRSKIMVSGPSP